MLVRLFLNVDRLSFCESTTMQQFWKEVRRSRTSTDKRVRRRTYGISTRSTVTLRYQIHGRLPVASFAKPARDNKTPHAALLRSV